MTTLTTLQIVFLIAGTLAIVVIVFIMVRELIAWYYKVNQRIELLESILKEIQLLNINIKHN